MTNGFVIQRVVDGWYFNGFRRDPWSKSVVAAIAYATKEEAQDEMDARGWKGVVYLPLPRVRQKPVTAPGILYVLRDENERPS